MSKVLGGEVKDVVVAGIDGPGDKVRADDKAAGVGIGGTHVCVLGREVDVVGWLFMREGGPFIKEERKK